MIVQTYLNPFRSQQMNQKSVQPNLRNIQKLAEEVNLYQIKESIIKDYRIDELISPEFMIH